MTPSRSTIRRTSWPDRTRSLPTRRLEPRDEDFCVKSSFDFGRIGALQEQFHRFFQIGCRLLHGIALTCDVQFGTERHIPVTLPFNDRSIARSCHPDLLPIASLPRSTLPYRRFRVP